MMNDFDIHFFVGDFFLSKEAANSFFFCIHSSVRVRDTFPKIFNLSFANSLENIR